LSSERASSKFEWPPPAQRPDTNVPSIVISFLGRYLLLALRLTEKAFFFPPAPFLLRGGESASIRSGFWRKPSVETPRLPSLYRIQCPVIFPALGQPSRPAGPRVVRMRLPQCLFPRPNTSVLVGLPPPPGLGPLQFDPPQNTCGIVPFPGFPRYASTSTPRTTGSLF